MDTITYTVATNPYTLSVLAEGGAAGPGGSVVSEGQAYGVLTAALALADTDASNPLYEAALNKFYGYYNGWKRMCENSESTSYCQATKYLVPVVGIVRYAPDTMVWLCNILKLP